MRRRRNAEERIFFPWEGRGGYLRRLGLHRIRLFLGALVVIAFVALIATRERAGSGVRQTRAILLDVRAAMEAYLADHEGECPKSLAALTDYGAFKDAPSDAWGRPLRLLCPGRADRTRYEIWSDGPDGQPGGLDRIE